MTPGEVATLAAKLDALHDDVREVKTLAQETNGRVRTLETWRAGIDVLMRIRAATEGARRTAFVAVLAAATGGFATFVASLIFHA